MIRTHLLLPLHTYYEDKNAAERQGKHHYTGLFKEYGGQ